jgi:hypothetical protein
VPAGLHVPPPTRLKAERRRRVGLTRPPRCSFLSVHHPPLLCRAHPRVAHGSTLGS